MADMIGFAVAANDLERRGIPPPESSRTAFIASMLGQGPISALVYSRVLQPEPPPPATASSTVQVPIRTVAIEVAGVTTTPPRTPDLDPTVQELISQTKSTLQKVETAALDSKSAAEEAKRAAQSAEDAVKRLEAKLEGKSPPSQSAPGATKSKP